VLRASENDVGMDSRVGTASIQVAFMFGRLSIKEAFAPTSSARMQSEANGSPAPLSHGLRDVVSRPRGCDDRRVHPWGGKP